MSYLGKEGAENFIEGHLAYCRRAFEEEGELRPLAVIVARKSPKGERLPEPAIILIPPIGDFGGDMKTQFSKFLRDFVKKVDAVGIVFSSEVWMATGDAMSVGKGDDLSKRPDRTEGLMHTFEHEALAEPRVYTVEISRDSAGKGTLGEARVSRGSSGRFFNFMNRAGSS